jgi:hypothetical protein
MKLVHSLFLAFCLFTSFHLSAQFGFGPPVYGVPYQQRVYSSLIIEAGDPRAVLGKHIKTVFVYDNITVGKMSEGQYVAEKVQHYNNKKEGRGDAWSKNWYESRVSKYQPSFIETFNDFGSKIQTSVFAGADSAQITLTLHTTFIEPGYNAFVSGSPAEIDVSCVFKDVAGNMLLKINAEHVPGYSGLSEDYEVTNRLMECYAKLGKDLAKKIRKESKRKRS